jgi:hypothetical protein
MASISFVSMESQLPEEYKADKFDKYRSLLLGRGKPTDKQKVQLDRYHQAWTLVISGYSHTSAANILLSTSVVDSFPTGMRIVRECLQVYATLKDTSKAGQKVAAAENHRRLAKKLEQQEKWLEASIVHEKADKLLGLDKEDKFQGLDPKDFLRPAILVFTTDAAELDKGDVTQDTDYEEIKESDGEEE